MKFKSVAAHPGETRRYVTDPGYGHGTYVITRGVLGSWTAWFINLDRSAPTQGWLTVAVGQRTMAAARMAAQRHSDSGKECFVMPS
jgi:hypothetical protein